MRISDWSSDVCSSDLGDDGKIAGVQSYATNQVPNEAGTPETGVAILGDWSQVLLGVWSEIDILVNPYAQPAYGRGGVLIRAMSTVDVAVRHPDRKSTRLNSSH